MSDILDPDGSILPIGFGPWERRDFEKLQLLIDERNANPPSQPLFGVYDYNDAATASTPITLTADTETILTNDGLGPFTNTAYGFDDVTPYDISANEFDWSDLELGDTVDVRLDVTVTTTSANEQVTTGMRLALGGSTYTIKFDQSQFRRSGVYQMVSFSSVYMGDADTLNNPAEMTVETDSAAGTSVVVNGWYVRVWKRSRT